MSDYIKTIIISNLDKWCSGIDILFHAGHKIELGSCAYPFGNNCKKIYSH